MAEKKADVTLGEYLDAVRAKYHFDNEGTLKGYETCLRRIASDVCKIDGKGRYDYAGGARDAWLARVHAIRLSALTPAKVAEWQVAYLRKATPDPLSQRRVKVSCSTTIRQAQSLFSKPILAAVSGSIELPDPLPFSGLKRIERQSLKYTSQIDLQALFGAAYAELSANRPELFMVFLLAVTGGLRRREIDLLPWSAFNWNASTIEIRPTEHFAAKSEDSYGSVQMEPGIMGIFRGYHAQASGPFLIESKRPVKSVRWNRYRCQPHFEALSQWLRAQGISGNKPLHTLRKEFGSSVCAAHGVYAASRALRHADINITTQFYTESRSRVTAGMSHLLPPAADKVVEFPKESKAAS
jgi:integrase